MIVPASTPVCRRTWILLATMAFAFINSYLSRPSKPVAGEVSWDYSELGTSPYEQWVAIGVILAVAVGISVLADIIRKRRVAK